MARLKQGSTVGGHPILTTNDVAYTAEAGKVAIRDDEGKLQVADPVDGLDAANKQYVDEKVVNTTITISDTSAPTSDSGTPTTLLGWIANMIKSITGELSWRTNPVASLKTIWDKFNASSGHKHTGAADDAPKLDPAESLTYVPVNKAGDVMTGPLRFSISLPSGVDTDDTPDKWPNEGIAIYSASLGMLQNQPSNYGKILHISHGGVKFQLFFEWKHPNGGASGTVFYRHAGEDDTSWGQWNKMWNDGNDGSGSGLDADKLRGKAYYIQSSAPSGPTAGELWYDTTENRLKYYNGSSWIDPLKYQ